MILVRHHIGGVLRRRRQRLGRTLREVSAQAQVSLGYLSEVERGEKEASSELLAAICAALDLPLSVVLREVSDELVRDESALVGVPPRRVRVKPIESVPAKTVEPVTVEPVKRLPEVVVAA